jgi:hypothetical protein
MSKYYCPCCSGHHEEGIEHCKAFSQLPSLKGIEVVEKCLNDEGVITPWISSTPEGCPLCKGTGTITRQAEWGDIDFTIVDLLQIITDLQDNSDCSLDHHGYCQEHSWLTKGLCPQFRISKILTTKSGGRLRVKK